MLRRRAKKLKQKKEEIKRVHYSKLYEPEKVFLLTTHIILSKRGNSGAGPRGAVQQYFLGIKEEDKFYELFSKVEFTGENKFDIPHIIKVESISKYIEDTEQMLSSEELFQFVLKKNMELILNLNK